MDIKEQFYTLPTPEGKEDACFLMQLNVGVVHPKKTAVTFSVDAMVGMTKEALMIKAGHKPQNPKNVRDWTDKMHRLADAYAYWFMMQRMGFSVLPITRTEEGAYAGHAICEGVTNGASEPQTAET